jgi:hypothetical protein
MTDIYTNLVQYKHSIVSKKINNIDTYLDVNANIGSGDYVNCLSNFWYGGFDIVDANINLVMGHSWQHFSGKGIRVITNDLKITKEIENNSNHIKYGLTEETHTNKEYYRDDDDFKGITTNCTIGQQYPRLYREDVASAYAFNGFVLGDQSERYPQALNIIYTGDAYIVNIIRASSIIMSIHMNKLSEENIKEINPIEYRKKYIKYKRKIDELKHGRNSYRIRRNWNSEDIDGDDRIKYDIDKHSLYNIIQKKIERGVPLTSFDREYIEKYNKKYIE